MQTFKESCYEVMWSIGSGFVLGAFLQHFVVTPLFNLNTSGATNLGISLFYTVVAIIRQLVVRRYFNKKSIKKLYKSKKTGYNDSIEKQGVDHDHDATDQQRIQDRADRTGCARQPEA